MVIVAEDGLTDPVEMMLVAKMVAVIVLPAAVVATMTALPVAETVLVSVVVELQMISMGKSSARLSKEASGIGPMRGT
jgi:hypothetical protein